MGGKKKVENYITWKNERHGFTCMPRSNRKVNEVQIKIIELEFLQAVLTSLNNMPMIRIPKLQSESIPRNYYRDLLMSIWKQKIVDRNKIEKEIKEKTSGRGKQKPRNMGSELVHVRSDKLTHARGGKLTRARSVGRPWLKLGPLGKNWWILPLGNMCGIPAPIAGITKNKNPNQVAGVIWHVGIIGTES